MVLGAVKDTRLRLAPLRGGLRPSLTAPARRARRKASGRKAPRHSDPSPPARVEQKALKRTEQDRPGTRGKRAVEGFREPLNKSYPTRDRL